MQAYPGFADLAAGDAFVKLDLALWWAFFTLMVYVLWFDNNFPFQNEEI